MDFYLTNLTSGVRLRIPILPDRLSIKTGAATIAFNVIKTGEVKIPRGSMLTGYSWTSTLPGETMRRMPFVYDWQTPDKTISLLKEWMNGGDTLRFMATDITINTDVFIESFAYEYYGMGDVSYTITLTVRRELLIETVPAQTVTPNDSNSAYGTVKLRNTNSHLNVRQTAASNSKIIGKLDHGARIQIINKSGNWYIIPWGDSKDGKGYVYASYVVLDTQSSGDSDETYGNSSSSSSGKTSSSGGKDANSSKTTVSNSTYKVKSGDSLYSIAKAMLGDGARWMEIYELNRTAIDKANTGKTVSKYTVNAGIVLKMPSKTTSKSKSKASSSKASSIFAKAAKSIVSAAANSAKTVTTKRPSRIIVGAAATAVKASAAATSKVGGLLKALKAATTKQARKSSAVKTSNASRK
jgi:hypothetical protein